MKAWFFIGLLINSFAINAMEVENAVIPVPLHKPKGKVTVITEYPFDITKNGRYALEKGKTINILDLFDGKKSRHSDVKKIAACINTCKNVTWLQLNLKGSVIDGKNFYFPFLHLYQSAEQKKIEIYNGTIKNFTDWAPLYVIFNNKVKVHDIKFEDCATPFFVSPSSFKSWNIVVMKKGKEDKSMEYNIKGSK